MTCVGRVAGPSSGPRSVVATPDDCQTRRSFESPYFARNPPGTTSMVKTPVNFGEWTWGRSGLLKGRSRPLLYADMRMIPSPRPLRREVWLSNTPVIAENVSSKTQPLTPFLRSHQCLVLAGHEYSPVDERRGLATTPGLFRGLWDDHVYLPRGQHYADNSRNGSRDRLEEPQLVPGLPARDDTRSRPYLMYDTFLCIVSRGKPSGFRRKTRNTLTPCLAFKAYSESTI